MYTSIIDVYRQLYTVLAYLESGFGQLWSTHRGSRDRVSSSGGYHRHTVYSSIGTLYVATQGTRGGGHPHPGGRGVTVLTPQVSTEHSSWLTKAGGCGTGRVILTK